MRLALVACALALVLGGCIGTNDAKTPPAAAVSPASTHAAAPAASATGASAAAGAANATTAEPVKIDIPIKGSGNTGDSLCLPDPTGGCSDQGLAARKGNSFFVPDLKGATPLHGKLKVTWTADSPATATLGVAFMAMKKCDGGMCGHGLKWIEGASPLTLDTDLVLKDGESLMIGIGAPCKEIGPSEECIGPDQSVAWDGTITAISAP